MSDAPHRTKEHSVRRFLLRTLGWIAFIFAVAAALTVVMMAVGVTSADYDHM